MAGVGVKIFARSVHWSLGIPFHHRALLAAPSPWGDSLGFPPAKFGQPPRVPLSLRGGGARGGPASRWAVYFGRRTLTGPPYDIQPWGSPGRGSGSGGEGSGHWSLDSSDELLCFLETSSLPPQSSLLRWRVWPRNALEKSGQKPLKRPVPTSVQAGLLSTMPLRGWVGVSAAKAGKSRWGGRTPVQFTVH